MVAAASLLLCNCASNSFIVCGHRGAMGHETENTIASINKGVALKADMLEIDVFKIKRDSRIIFFSNTVSSAAVQIAFFCSSKSALNLCDST